MSWAGPATRCPQCGLDLGRHGWIAALWINTWVTILAVVAWIVVGMVLTGARSAWWVTGGAVAIAVVVPPFNYRYAKAVMLRLLHRFDPPEEDAR